MAENGKMFKVTMYVTSVLVSGVIMFNVKLAGSVISNDQASRSRDTAITEKVTLIKDNLTKDVTGMKETLAGMNVKLGYMDENFREQRVMQQKMMNMLEKMNDK